MKTAMKHSLVAAGVLALTPTLPVSADDQGPDFGLESRATTKAPVQPTSNVPDIKIEIDGKKIELNGNQIEAMVGEVLKSLSADNGKGARDMVSGLLGVEPGNEAEMLRALMAQIPQIAGEGAASFELGGEPGIDFEAKAFMIGPDGEKREIEINADEIRRNWQLHRGHAEHTEPVPAPEAEQVEAAELPPYYIGVTVTPAPESLRGHLGLPENTGVVIGEVFEGTPAAAAGLQPHDVIVKADGQPQASLESLMKAVREAGAKPMKLEVMRKGKTEEVTVTPMKREQPSVSGLFVPKIEAQADEQSGGQDELQELRDEVRETHKLLEKILDRMEKLESAEE
jgi:hypothetical protein